MPRARLLDRLRDQAGDANAHEHDVRLAAQRGRTLARARPRRSRTRSRPSRARARAATGSRPAPPPAPPPAAAPRRRPRARSGPRRSAHPANLLHQHGLGPAIMVGRRALERCGRSQQCGGAARRFRTSSISRETFFGMRALRAREQHVSTVAPHRPRSPPSILQFYLPRVPEPPRLPETLIGGAAAPLFLASCDRPAPSPVFFKHGRAALASHRPVSATQCPAFVPLSRWASRWAVWLSR